MHLWPKTPPKSTIENPVFSSVRTGGLCTGHNLKLKAILRGPGSGGNPVAASRIAHRRRTLATAGLPDRGARADSALHALAIGAHLRARTSRGAEPPRHRNPTLLSAAPRPRVGRGRDATAVVAWHRRGSDQGVTRSLGSLRRTGPDTPRTSAGGDEPIGVEPLRSAPVSRVARVVGPHRDANHTGHHAGRDSHCGDSTTAMGGSASPGDRTTDIGSRDSGAASRLSVAHRVLERCAAFSARRFAGGSR